MKTSTLVVNCAIGLCALLGPLELPGQTNSTVKRAANAQSAAPTPGPTPKSQQVHSEGERLFAQNCSRCHNAPEGFSPRIAGTVVRHMRVRAQLSAHEEQELLRFFNP